jgi:dihydroorotase
MTKTLIKNGYLIDPKNNISGLFDVLLVDDKIESVAPQGTLAISDAKEIEASGLVVCPGFIDLHCHLREPGFEYKETISTGTASAVSGGFTSICCMANTHPVNDNATVTDFIHKQARETGSCHVYPIGAITKDLKGEALANIAELNDAGCIAISDDGNTIQNARLMKIALDYARSFDLPVTTHSLEINLANNGHMNASIMSTRLGLKGIPNVAEDIIIARDIMLAEQSGAHLHVGHVSTAIGVQLIQEAKKRGAKVTCEVTPHHFSLTDEALVGYNTNFKMCPPLRTGKDVDALKKAFQNGVVDAIATDHAPHGIIDKELEFDRAAFGIIGFETALPLSLNLVRENIITLEEMVSLLTVRPAGVFRLSGGTLTQGSCADIALFDQNVSWTLDEGKIYSKSKNSPFLGTELTGRVVKTFVKGKLVYDVSSGVL